MSTSSNRFEVVRNRDAIAAVSIKDGAIGPHLTGGLTAPWSCEAAAAIKLVPAILTATVPTI